MYSRKECAVEKIIRLAICDDDQAIQSFMQKVILSAVAGYSAKVVCETYTKAESLYEAAVINPYDLIFLDIEMQDMNGFELCRQLNREVPSSSIVFVSNYSHYVFKAYEFRVLWFVRKEFLTSEIPKAIKKYFERTALSQRTFKVKQGVIYKKIFIQQIVYFECTGHEITVHTVSDTLKFYGSLKKIEEELQPLHFVRTNKNYLVNIKYIFSVNLDNVELMEAITIPLSKEHRKTVKERLAKYDV